MPLIWTETQPFGIADIEPGAASRYAIGARDPLVRADTVCCCVRGCPSWLAKRSRGANNPAAFCQDHRISVSLRPTYVYRDYRDNFIVNVAHLGRVKELKVESWRLGNERSEDALSWNVFVALAGLGRLKSAFQCLTGCETETEPELYLWGVRITGGEPSRWCRLMEVRCCLECGAGFPTEPDVILRVPGSALVLIEAKFGSPNGTLKGHEDRFGGVSEFLARYPCREGRADPLNREWVESQGEGQVLQQLVRNIIFAQWLADEGEQQWVVNLVRGGEELDVEQRIAAHLTPDSPVRFRRRSWEDLFQLPVFSEEAARPLNQYVRNKTIGLAKAFQC